MTTMKSNMRIVCPIVAERELKKLGGSKCTETSLMLFFYLGWRERTVTSTWRMSNLIINNLGCCFWVSMHPYPFVRHYFIPDPN